MNEQVKSFAYAVAGVLTGLVILDMFGIAEQGSLKIAHRGQVGRKAVKAKQTITGQTAALYQ